MFNMIQQMMRERMAALSFSGGRTILLGSLLALLTACPPPPGAPECVEADQFGSVQFMTLKVPANQKLTEAGIKVEQGSNITAEVSGLIDLCADRNTYKSVEQEKLDKDGAVIAKLGAIRADYNVWQRATYTSEATGAVHYERVNKGDKFTIVVDGTFSDRTGVKEDGRGLYVYIGDTPPPDSRINPADPQSPSDPSNPNSYWFGTAPSYWGGYVNSIENRKTGKSASVPQFFEMYDNSTVGAAGGFSGTAPASGYLWFKYARTTYTPSLHFFGINNIGMFSYSPWLGQYAWADEGRCRACMQTTIMAACSPLIILGPLYPVCIAGWQAGCAGTGFLEEAYGGKSFALVNGIPTGSKFTSFVTYSGRYCREHYDWQDIDSASGNIWPGNHWIDNDYDGSQGDNVLGYHPNKDGYDVTIGRGCPGTYGQHMDMVIGQSQVSQTVKMVPEGCTTGGVGSCEIARDSWDGLPILEAKYSIPSPDAEVDMDLRVPNGTSIPLKGQYTSPLPAGGELWFRINDNETSATHPDEGYYQDNVGHYTVNIVTKRIDTGFSDFMQDIINPIRGMIFGYCRIPPPDPNDPNTTLQDYENYNPDARYTTDEATCDANYNRIENGQVVSAWQQGITRRLYNKLTGGTVVYGVVVGNPFLSLVRAALVLFVVLYGASFFLGLISRKQDEFLGRMVRFCIVLMLLTDTSWQFFSRHMFDAFVYGVDDLIAVMSSEFTGAATSLTTGVQIVDDNGQFIESGTLQRSSSYVAPGSNIFAFADLTFNMFFQIPTWIKVAGLLFASPIGIIYILILVLGFIVFLFCIIKALILYLLALLSISLLLAVSPIFISFMLFNRTRPLFNGWVYNLFSFGIQPVFVFTALAIFNLFVYSIMYTILYYRVCWQSVFTLDIANFMSIPLLKFYMPAPSGFDPVVREDLPIQFFLIFIYLILIHAMANFIDWMGELGSHLALNTKQSSLAEAAQKIFDTAMAVIKGWGALAGKAMSEVTKSMGSSVTDKLKEQLNKVKDKAKGAAKNAGRQGVNAMKNSGKGGGDA